MNLTMYLIIAILALVAIVFIMGKLLRSKSKKLKDETERAEQAELREAKTRENIEAVLNYEKQDAILKKQRDKHVDALVKTRSKGVVEDEVEALMSDIRDAYNSL